MQDEGHHAPVESVFPLVLLPVKQIEWCHFQLGPFPLQDRGILCSPNLLEIYNIKMI